MSYSYDRRPVVADATAAPKKPAKIQPIIPFHERDEVLKHLTACEWIVDNWVTHSNPDFALGHEYGATPETYKKMAKFRDELKALADTVRSHL
jgi:hypothetical protein